MMEASEGAAVLWFLEMKKYIVSNGFPKKQEHICLDFQSNEQKVTVYSKYAGVEGAGAQMRGVLFIHVC